jgi:hypothetical protein
MASIIGVVFHWGKLRNGVIRTREGVVEESEFVEGNFFREEFYRELGKGELGKGVYGAANYWARREDKDIFLVPAILSGNEKRGSLHVMHYKYYVALVTEEDNKT